MTITIDQFESLPDGFKFKNLTWNSGCKHCNKPFAGRADAEHCSENCAKYTSRGATPKPYQSAQSSVREQATEIRRLAEKLIDM